MVGVGQRRVTQVVARVGGRIGAEVVVVPPNKLPPAEVVVVFPNKLPAPMAVFCGCVVVDEKSEPAAVGVAVAAPPNSVPACDGADAVLPNKLPAAPAVDVDVLKRVPAEAAADAELPNIPPDFGGLRLREGGPEVVGVL